MYIPLLPLGIWTILWDLGQKGQSLPPLRFSLTVVGFILTIWGGLTMIGMGNSQVKTTADMIKLLHWNVKWGGIGYNGHLTKNYKGDEWPVIRTKIYQYHPDIIVLSEPPQLDDWLAQLTQQMGPHWSMLKRYRTERNGIAIFAAGHLQLKRFIHVRQGMAMLVVATIHGQALHLLLVDGERSVRELKTPLLTDVIQATLNNSTSRQTIDMIIGDFNAVSRSIGFDSYAIAAGGYQLAGKSTRGLRGTWPFFLPLFDIDHVWLHNRFQIMKVDLFSNINTDHRGQMVYFKKKGK